MQAAWWTDFGQWLIDLLLWFPRKVFQLLLEGIASVIGAIPVPEFMSSLGSWVSSIDPAIAYFGGPLQFGAGMSFVLTAWVIRFVLRRIPVVG